MADRNRISSKQLLVFVVSSQIGLGIWTISANLAKNTGHDGWISMFLAGLIMALISVLIMLLLKRYHDQTVLEISKHLFGNLFGTIINVTFLLYLLCFAAFEVRAFTEFTRILFLPLTPPLILSCLLLLPTIYLTWNGLDAVCKFSQVIFLFLGFIIVIALMLHNQFHFSFLMPFGAAGAGKILKSTAITTFIFLGPELIAFIYSNIHDKGPSLRWVISANFITTFFYTLVCLISIALFGESMLVNLKLSLFDVSRFHQIGIFERMDFVFLILWFPFLESALRIYYFTAYHTFNRVLNLKQNIRIYLLFIVLVIALSRIPKNFNELFVFSNYISYWGSGIIVLLILYYLLSFLIKKGIEHRR
jgi:spore germination protein (amino acid permease)